jgi:cytochrome c oxidase subunit IV
MATHDTHSDEATVGFDEHHGPGVKAYLLVFAGLALFTLVSFVTNYWARQDLASRAPTSFAIILTVSVLKTCLVGAFFMHLIVDWRKVYYLLIPAFILGTMMMIVLMPDIVLAWHYM